MTGKDEPRKAQPAARHIGAALTGQQRPPLPKRFYQAVTVEPAGDSGFKVLLDGRPIRTPAKRALTVPGRGLAEALAAEWQAQTAVIDPATMPLTRLVNSALDGVTGREAEVRADIVAYAGSDLVCYLAAGPDALVERQMQGWQPVHRWLADELGVQLRLSRAVLHVAQERALSDRLETALSPCDAFALGALHVMTTLTGSAVLAFAVLRGRLGADEAWSLTHIDEDYQIETWGQDGEAGSRREARRIEMLAAGRLLGLSQASASQA